MEILTPECRAVACRLLSLSLMPTAKKKPRVAQEMEKSGATVDTHSASLLADGATAAVLAQQSGIMPIAVTLFTLLSAAHFWRNISAVQRSG